MNRYAVALMVLCGILFVGFQGACRGATTASDSVWAARMDSLESKIRDLQSLEKRMEEAKNNVYEVL